uniref:Uncharacterized protein n=1 Tax=Ascaris lumbricoides TaxID=6252 RepID=A0A0M3IME7_ASCLU
MAPIDRRGSICSRSGLITPVPRIGGPTMDRTHRHLAYCEKKWLELIEEVQYVHGAVSSLQFRESVGQLWTGSASQTTDLFDLFCCH